MGLLWGSLFNFGFISAIIILFCLWMFVDCLLHDVKDKIFWAILILGTGPVGAAIYAMERPKLLGEMSYNPVENQAPPSGQATPGVVPTTPGVAATTAKSMSASSQIIRGIGMTIAAVFAVGGALMVGFVILVMLAFSGWGGGSSK